MSFIEYNKKNHNWQNQYCLAITNQKMNQDLIKHGAVPNKSLSLEFPNDISNDLIRHFVRGILMVMAVWRKMKIDVQ